MRLACVRHALATLIIAVTAAGGMDAAWAQALWANLTPIQQVALAPLADQWPQLSPVQQRNWMAVSRHYARMTPNERQMLQDRMTEWTALTPSERSQARFNFNAIKSSRLSAQERRTKWEEYRTLPPAERKRLAKNHHALRGAAPALHPPLPGWSVKPPVMRASTAQLAIQPPADVYNAPRRISRVVIPADRHTLLPNALLETENRAP